MSTKLNQEPHLPFIIDVLIPAYNEEESIPLVLTAIPRNLVRQVIVCNNGSTDRTAFISQKLGAIVVEQPKPGYGNACLMGINYLKQLPKAEQPDIIVFLDADFSDYPEEMYLIVAPIIKEKKQLVIGSRMLKKGQSQAMTIPQRFGNWLAPLLIRWLYGVRFTDLGPFRAIRWPDLLQLKMQDPNYGWTVEMQVKAAKKHLSCLEVPVSYRKRAAGKSKVSGTIKGSVLAGLKIIGVILKELRTRPNGH